MTRAVAYIRRSSDDERSGAGNVSREVQEQAIRDLVAADPKLSGVEFFVDWGRSADEQKIARRVEYARMLRVIETDPTVTVVYAYALDRLYRSMKTFVQFTDLCRTHGVRIITQRDGALDDTSPMGKAFGQITAVFAELELNTSKSRAASNIKRRRARGDDFGYAPYGKRIDTKTHRLVDRDDEDVTAVVEAYGRAGTFSGAARLLNGDAPDLAERARPRRASGWSDQSVQRVVRREGAAPELKARGWSRKRAETAAETFPLYRLLVCPHDGRRLVGMRTTSGNGKRFNRYFCPAARHDSAHPRPYAIAESIVLPWVLERIGTRRVVTRRQTITTDDATTQRTDLAEAKRRAGVAYRAGAMTDDEFVAEVARIDATLAELPGPDEDAAAVSLTFTSGSPSATVERVVLDGSFRPSDIRWKATA